MIGCSLTSSDQSYEFFFLCMRRPPRSPPIKSSAASDVYKRQSNLRVALSTYTKKGNKWVFGGEYLLKNNPYKDTKIPL